MLNNPVCIEEFIQEQARALDHSTYNFITLLKIRLYVIIITIHLPNSSSVSWSSQRYTQRSKKIPLNRKWQDYVYIQCEYKSTKQKIKHLLREENKVKENKIS